jgi:methylated-DNA-[protein]-cysteine S-methyltransferase
MTMNLIMTTIDSPIGALHLFADGDGLAGLTFPGRPAPAGAVEGHARVLDDVEEQLREYFAKKRKTFDVELAPAGTPFQRLVWRALEGIPFGVTCSYSDIAKKIGRPAASRAVGAANGANPISIIVPCHRVIGASGDLTGYGGGMPNKKWLLAHEGAQLELVA